MKKFVSICLLCAMSVSVLASCGKPNFEGEWSLCNANGETLDYSVIFKDDEIVKVNDEIGKYKVADKDTIKIEIDGGNYKCDFEIIDEDEKLIYLEGFEEYLLIAEKKLVTSVALTLMRESNFALFEMDGEGIYHENRAIICSDSSKNINANFRDEYEEFDFVERVKKFFHGIDDFEYIIYIDDFTCVNIIVKKPESEIVVTYPAGEFDGMTFDEIYEELKGRIE